VFEGALMRGGLNIWSASAVAHGHRSCSRKIRDGVALLLVAEARVIILENFLESGTLVCAYIFTHAVKQKN